VYRVPEADRRCPKCGRTDLKPLGSGAESTFYDYKPARLVAVRQVQETLACPCGEHVVRAQGPTKWKEKSRYSVFITTATLDGPESSCAATKYPATNTPSYGSTSMSFAPHW
jgi:hypothetical protein